ncbi:MAG: hypothetical protein JSU07_05900 [Bacteroidetes bacterium]|nr:hypothetical protein [Bacteroidota bacterium]
MLIKNCPLNGCNSNIYGYSYTNKTQMLVAQTGNNDIQLNFANYYSYGKCRIDFYENSTLITKTKYLKW